MQKESNLALLAAAGLAGGGYLAYRKYREGRRKSESKGISMRDVDSSMIRELGYSPKSRVMHARFNTGRRYRYEGVPLNEYKMLREAESVGTYFNRHFRGKYDHEKIGSLRKEAFGAAVTGGLIGAGVGGLMQDSQGNSGGIGGALAGAMMGAAGGHLTGKGVASIGSKVKSPVKKPTNTPTTPTIKAPPPATPPPPAPAPKSGLQGIDNIDVPNMDFSMGPRNLLQVPGAVLGYGRDAARSGASAVSSRVSAAVDRVRPMFAVNPNWQPSGAQLGAPVLNMRTGGAAPISGPTPNLSVPNLGVVDTVNRAARNVTLSANLRAAPINVPAHRPVPIVKSASYGGITLINDESFEKVAYTPAVTTLSQVGLGAAVGAIANPENRVNGAIAGGLVGGVAGAALGRMGGKSIAKSNLQVTTKSGYGAPELQLFNKQKSALEAQLKSTEGVLNKHKAVQTFVDNPANTEFAKVYRQSMLGGAAGASLLGGMAGVTSRPQNKTAAYKAVERFNRVRRY